MSSELVFMMGQFEARFPTDRRYATNHMWAQQMGDHLRFGFSAYAVRLLQDVYFLDWSIDSGTQLLQRQLIGSIESEKAESDLFAPMTGRLADFNHELLSDPSSINVDTYSVGWLFEMQDVIEASLSAEEYMTHLDASWAIAERTIKGQINE